MSVAVVLIPQSLAYAQLAGLPPERGLYAATLPLLGAALLTASPSMQAGPSATSSLLAFGALSALAVPYSADYVQLAMLLAFVVGAIRLGIGLGRLGWIAHLLSSPVLIGFTPAAAILIASSQVPAIVGATPPQGNLLTEAAWSLANPGPHALASLAFAGGTIMLIRAPARRWPLFPGVLCATVVGIACTEVLAFQGQIVGSFHAGAPPLSLNLPWGELSALLVPALVLAVAGFAEPTAVARAIAEPGGKAWDPGREFISQGAANVVAGTSGGFPISASLSRSALNRSLGGRTRWSAVVTACTVLAILPWSHVLAPLPQAVLAAIVVAAVSHLVRLRPIAELWRWSRPQCAIALITFTLTLSLSPHVEHALLVGVVLAVGVHLWRECELDIPVERNVDTLRIAPTGVLFFGTAARFTDKVLEHLADEPRLSKLVIDLSGVGRIDVSGARSLSEVTAQARAMGLDVRLAHVPRQSIRVLSALEPLYDRPVARSGE